MRIINTFDKIPGCFKNSAFDLDAWRVYARAISPELGEKCERDSRKYDFNNDVLPTILSASTIYYFFSTKYLGTF